MPLEYFPTLDYSDRGFGEVMKGCRMRGGSGGTRNQSLSVYCLLLYQIFWPASSSLKRWSLADFTPG